MDRLSRRRADRHRVERGSLIQEYSRRGLKSDQEEIFVIEEVEEVDYPSAWMV